MNNRNIDYVLHNIPIPQLKALTGKEIANCLQWIVNKVSYIDYRYSGPVQGLYLCVIFNHLFASHKLELNEAELFQKEVTKFAFDHLITCLSECAKYKHIKIPSIFGNCLEQIAYVLVMNSSWPGWLTFAAYFYRFFHMQRLLQQDIPNMYYDKDRYWQLLNELLPKMEKVHCRNEIILRQFLRKVFQSAPDGNLLFELCEYQPMSKFFHNLKDKDKFLTECYLDHISGSNKGEMLKKLLIIPEKFRNIK